MRPGSVIVDLAAEQGGNCEASEAGSEVVVHGVSVIAPLNLAATIPHHASQLYAKNLANFVLNMTKKGELQTGRRRRDRQGQHAHPRRRGRGRRGCARRSAWRRCLSPCPPEPRPPPRPARTACYTFAHGIVPRMRSSMAPQSPRPARGHARRPDPEVDLAEAALLVAAQEYADLDVRGYLVRLDEMGARCACGSRTSSGPSGR